MSWVSLGEALENAVAKALESGETGVGAPSQPKRTPTEAGAKFTGQRPTKGETVENDSGTANSGRMNRAPLRTSRWEYTATKAGAPLSEAVYCHLRVIEGGRKTGEGTRLPASAQTSLRTRRANWLKLVSG